MGTCCSSGIDERHYVESAIFMRVDKASCTHFCKWDDNATGGRWVECVILSENDDEYKVRCSDGECDTIPKGSMSEKANQGEVEVGDFVLAYKDDRDKDAHCTNIKEFYNQGHFWGTWYDDNNGFFGGADIVISKDLSWTYGTVSWDG